MERSETKPCPACGANMLRCSTGFVFLSHPPKSRESYRCLCGCEEDLGFVSAPLPETFEQRWQRLNPGREEPARPAISGRKRLNFTGGGIVIGDQEG